MGFGLPARPSDGYKARKSDNDLPRGTIPRSVNRTGSKDMGIPPRRGRQTSLPSLQANKTAQSPTSCSSAPPRSTLRSPLDPQNKTLSQTHKSHSQTGSGSSSSTRSSTRSFDNTSKATRVLHGRVRPTVSRESAPFHSVWATSSSSNLAHRSQESVDAGLEFQHDRKATESPAQIHAVEAVGIRKELAQPAAIYPELDRYRNFQPPDPLLGRREIDVPYQVAAHDLPPPTPLSLWFSGSSQMSAVSGSPSTKFSESPGPGPYSRDTTPTSLSSQSPVFVAPNRIGPPYRAARQHSLSSIRPPLTRRRDGSFSDEIDAKALDPTGLASVRESVTSSSSGSTVKEGARSARKEKMTGDRLPPSPPSPPPRFSSQKSLQPKDTGEEPSMSSSHPGGRHQEVVLSSPQSPRSKDASSLSQISPPARPRRHNPPSTMNSHLSTATPGIIQSNLTSTVRGAKEQSSVSVASSSPSRSTTSFLHIRKSPSTSNLSSIARVRAFTSSKSCSSVELHLKGATEPPSLPQSPQANTRTSLRRRFPFFGRKKPSSEAAAKVHEKAEQKNSVRKGPAAGTGHEGYGRVGAVGRRSASGSALPHKVVTSPQSSFHSLTSSDSFLADRVHPVIISGGEVVENRNTSSDLSRYESFHAVTARPSTDSKLSLARLSTTHSTSSSTIDKSPPRPPSQAHSIRRRPSNSSASEEIAMQSTLAFRRSMQRLRSVPDTPLRLPQPIDTSRNASSPSPLTSFDTSILSDGLSHVELQRSTSGESSALRPALKKVHKIPLPPRKWNIFSRSHNQISAKKKGKTKEQIAATVKTVEKRPVAFYTIIDATDQNERQQVSHADVQQVLREADLYSQSVNADAAASAADNSFASQRMSIPQHGGDWARQQSWNSAMENTSTTTMPSSSAVDYSHSVSSGRPSRLAQVGRIPQVVKNRRESPSPQILSRPRSASLHVPNNNNATKVHHNPQSIPTGLLSSPVSRDPMPELSMKNSTLHSGNRPVPNTTLSSSIASNDVGCGGKELLTPQKKSESTMYTSSSSSGAGNSFATTTAVVPNPEDPPIEDEVWDEYNDLLGDDSIYECKPAPSSKRVPSHLEIGQNKLTNQDALDSSILSSVKRCQNPMCYKGPKKPRPGYNSDVTGRIQPISVHAKSDPAAERLSCTPKRSSSSSSCQTFFSDCSACSSNDRGTSLAQVNLRVGSMTVSKWLTFGHVLFSDIRHQLNSVEALDKRHSILVIDGLGNDDWSFYAAETYPAASFFNLSPRASLAPVLKKNDPTGLPLSPPNHHQIQYTSHLDNFPFAPQSFDGVVYRFPAVAPESHYHNILSEARRVLRPDGYIELSILDSDLNNMGNRGRRSVRRLKERIRLQDPDMSFASTADLIVRLLGKVGFADIKAARVGIPVASSIAQPGTHTRQDKPASDNNNNAKKKKKQKKKNPPSLAEMMSDKSPSADENITRIVTRVGRWWYTRCYESAAKSEQEKSIWDDRSLLSECEQYRTSLKLMVCCARAPDGITSF
ncbi:hypothetical protein E4U43_007234 [Claviceps pusilla]|uniref:Methyltransferase type 11 domain-containing protein n=1 Tax=Claviceps pusilla TaxID=123648 RepID=A0A9P7NDC1_9HYPO|nr:hypothetical protein E4U43_007234 [Claviceps pusilla]